MVKCMKSHSKCAPKIIITNKDHRGTKPWGQWHLLYLTTKKAEVLASLSYNSPK